MADRINESMAGGKPVSRAAVYRMIEGGKLPVRRLGEKGEVWTTDVELLAAFGLEPEPAADAEPEREAA